MADQAVVSLFFTSAEQILRKSTQMMTKRFPVICLILFLVLTTGQVKAVGYSFFAKARSHYQSVTSSKSSLYIGNPKIDSALASQKDSISLQNAFTLSREISVYLLEKGLHARALDILNNVKQFLESQPDKNRDVLLRLSTVYNLIGAIYEETGLWNDALAMYMNSMRCCDETSNDAGKARIYNNIGKLYYGRNQLDKAEELFNKAVNINRTLKKRSELFDNYNNLAGVWTLRHNTRKALEYALIALSQLDVNTDFYNLSIAYSNIGSLYQDMRNYIVALSYYHQAEAIQVSKSYHLSLIRSYLSILSLFQVTGQQDSAMKYVNKSLVLCGELKNASADLLVYKEASKFYTGIGNYRRAYEFGARYAALKDSLEAENSLTRIEQIQAVYEVINKEKDNKILHQKINLQALTLQRQRTFLITAIIVVVFFLCLVFILIRNNRNDRTRNNLIIKQSDQLHHQEKQMMLDKERTLTLELDYKNRQLTSYALHLVRSNEFVLKTTDELRQILLGIHPRDKERAERIRQLISELHQYSSGNVWEEFRLYFEEVHQSFEKNLSAAYPDLSPNDKKICALLKLGLSTKDIAAITFRELRSVESARNRLRKKLGISAEVNIQVFLSKF
jgi:tetratricopeptide (TPR) repeat protein